MHKTFSAINITDKRSYLTTLCWVFLFIVSLTKVESSSGINDDYVDRVYIGFHDVATMPFSRSDSVAVTFPENIFGKSDGPRIYLTGGCIEDQQCTLDNGYLTCYCPAITDSCDYFSPETLTWSTNCSSSLTPRYRHMAAKVDNNMYIAGGRALDDSLITTIEKYNPITDKWSVAFEWPNATSDGIAFGVDDILYIVGGYLADYSSPGLITAINVTSGEFNSSLAKMPYGAGDIAGAQISGNGFYVIGGWSATLSNNFCTPLKSVQYYSIENNSWSIVDSLNYGRGDLAIGTIENKIFAVGGEKKDSSDTTCTKSVPVDQVERYNRKNNSWIIEEDIPSDLFRFIGASYNSSTSIYSSAIFLFGGQGIYENTSSTTGIFPIRNSTIKYIPQSIALPSHSKKVLSKGGIAGIVIAGIVVLSVLVCLLLSYCEYRRQGYYTNLDKLESNEGVPANVKSTMELIETSSNDKAAPHPLNSGVLVHAPMSDVEEARI
eukprot:gene8024-10873_t